MNIAMVNVVSGNGGTGRICTDLAELLWAQGDTCTVFYGRDAVPERYKACSVRVGNGTDVGLHAGIARLTDSAGCHSKAATRRMVRRMDALRPDVIHLHNLHGYYLDYGILFDYLKRAGVPVIWTLHDCWPFTGHCAHYDYRGCGQWQTGCLKCPAKKDYPASLFLDRSKTNYGLKKSAFTGVPDLTAVAVSDWMKGQAERSFLNEYKIVRIYNGVNRTVFRPTPSDIRKRLGIEGKRVLLGLAAPWTERKGKDFFLKLAGELRKDEVIVMAGLEKAAISRLPPGILGLGRITDARELARLYSAADIVLNPSWEESFGLVTAEALCCGTPVIVQDTTASPEMVDETCGRVIPRGDHGALRGAIDDIFRQGIRTEDCLRRADRFDRAVNGQQYLDLYRECAGHKKNRPTP